MPTERNEDIPFFVQYVMLYILVLSHTLLLSLIV